MFFILPHPDFFRLLSYTKPVIRSTLKNHKKSIGFYVDKNYLDIFAMPLIYFCLVIIVNKVICTADTCKINNKKERRSPMDKREI